MFFSFHNAQRVNHKFYFYEKIINTPESFVVEMCQGMAKAHPELEFVEKYKIIKKKKSIKKK
ncbi:hypothetical protein LEQ05_05595 [Riemerella anatipestifer]|nr:hypothetical protein LEQ05_05595 [Riemerella anatipestifer]